MFLRLADAGSFGLVRNFDPTTETTKLPSFRTSLTIGEVEHDGSGERGGAPRDRHHDDDD